MLRSAGWKAESLAELMSSLKGFEDCPNGDAVPKLYNGGTSKNYCVVCTINRCFLEFVEHS